MNVGSLFSGIGGMDYGLARAGFEHAFFCESDEWRRRVLAHHWPGVPIYEDVRLIGEPAGRTAADGHRTSVDEGRREAGAGIPSDLDLVAGGFPCQDLSVAGQRRGLAGERSGLFFEFARVIDLVRPRWVLVENVPGLLSSNGGRDFGIVLGTLADLGYGVGWRVLDSRFFGVPQRRRRVFIIGAVAVGDTRAAAERAGQVLAIGSRCPRHPATRGEARQDVAVASLSGLGTGGPDDNDGQGGRLVAETLREHPRPGSNSNGQVVAAPLSHGSNPNSNMAGRRREDDENLVAHALTSEGHDASEDGTGRGMPLISFDAEMSNQGEPAEHPYPTRKLRRAITSEATGVRRLTPREAERLQALPDDWTAHGPDSRRYAALGDAVTSSVAEWIGRRIAMAETANARTAA